MNESNEQYCFLTDRKERLPAGWAYPVTLSWFNNELSDIPQELREKFHVDFCRYGHLNDPTWLNAYHYSGSGRWHVVVKPARLIELAAIQVHFQKTVPGILKRWFRRTAQEEDRLSMSYLSITCRPDSVDYRVDNQH